MKKLRADQGRLVEVRLLEDRPVRYAPLRSDLIEGFDCVH
jgi:hypothetical protein